VKYAISRPEKLTYQYSVALHHDRRPSAGNSRERHHDRDRTRRTNQGIRLLQRGTCHESDDPLTFTKVQRSQYLGCNLGHEPQENHVTCI
jgi:hypothetical protein